MAARDLTERSSALAQRLFAIDGDPDVLFVRGQVNGRTRTSDEARQILAALEQAWLEYGVLVQAVAVGGGGGSPGSLQARLEEIATRAAHLAGRSREAVLRLDAADASVRQLTAMADVIGAPAATAVAVATKALEEWRGTVVDDPAFADGSEHARRIEGAHRLVSELERRRRELPGQRATAAALLAALVQLVGEGRAAWERARRKVVLEERHLLDPLDPSVIEGLGHALAAVDAECEGKAWPGAAERLETWRRDADGLLARARRIVEVNSSPVRHRDELRGRLEAYRSVAVLTGRAEDATLTSLHERACAELYREPCDLKAGERLVRGYVEALQDGA